VLLQLEIALAASLTPALSRRERESWRPLPLFG